MAVVNDLVPGVHHVNVGHPHINVTVQSVPNHSNPSLGLLVEDAPVVVGVKPGQVQIKLLDKLAEKSWFNPILNISHNLIMLKNELNRNTISPGTSKILMRGTKWKKEAVMPVPGLGLVQASNISDSRLFFFIPNFSYKFIFW